MLCLKRMRVWNSMRVYRFHIDDFDKNEILFRVIKYHVTITRNEILTHLHQNILSFWSAAEI